MVNCIAMELAAACWPGLYLHMDTRPEERRIYHDRENHLLKAVIQSCC